MELNCFKQVIGRNYGLLLATGAGGIWGQAGGAASFARAILDKYVSPEDYDLPPASFVHPLFYGQGREEDALALSVNILFTLNHFRNLSFAQAYEKRYYDLLCRQCTQILSVLEKGRAITGLAGRGQGPTVVEELRRYFREIRGEAEAKEAEGSQAGDGRAKEAAEERRLERERRFRQLLAEAGSRGNKWEFSGNPRHIQKNPQQNQPEHSLGHPQQNQPEYSLEYLQQNQPEHLREYPQQNQREFPRRAKGLGIGRGKRSIFSWKSQQAKQFFWRVQRASAMERQLILAASKTKTIVGLMNVLKTVKESQWAEYGAALWEQVKITAEDPAFLSSISRETADPGKEGRRNATKAEEDPGSGITADGETDGAVPGITEARKTLTIHLRRWIKESYRETEDEGEILAQKEGLINQLHEEWAGIGKIFRKGLEIEKTAEEKKREEYRQTRNVLAGSKVLAEYGLPVLPENFPKREEDSFAEYGWPGYWPGYLPEPELIRPVFADYIRQMEAGEWKGRIRALEKILEPEAYVISPEDIRPLFFAGDRDREKFARLYQQFREKAMAVRLRHWIKESYRETENEEEILAQKEGLIYQLYKGRKALAESKALAALGFPVLLETVPARERDGFVEYGLLEQSALFGPVFAGYIRQMEAGEWKDRVNALEKILEQEAQEAISLEDVENFFFAGNTGREKIARLYRQFRKKAGGENGQNGQNEQFPAMQPGEVREWYQAVMEAVSYLGETEWNGLKEELSASRKEILSASRKEISMAAPLARWLSGEMGDIREEKRTFIDALNQQMAEETELIRQMAEEAELVRRIGEERELIRQTEAEMGITRQAEEETGITRQMAEETGLFGQLADGAKPSRLEESWEPREWIKDFPQDLFIHLRRWLRENPEDPQNMETEAGEKARGTAGRGELRASRINRREAGREGAASRETGREGTVSRETGHEETVSRETGHEETVSQGNSRREADGTADRERQQQSLLALLKDEAFYFVQEFPRDALEIQETVSPVIRRMESIRDLDEQEWLVFKQALSAVVEEPLPPVSSLQWRFGEKAEIREEKRLLIQSLIRQITFGWTEEAFKETRREVFRESNKEAAGKTGRNTLKETGGNTLKETGGNALKETGRNTLGEPGGNAPGGADGNAPGGAETVRAELIRERSGESFARLQQWLEENYRESDDEGEIEVQKEHLLALLEHEVRYNYLVPEKDGGGRRESGEFEEPRETYGTSRQPSEILRKLESYNQVKQLLGNSKILSGYHYPEVPASRDARKSGPFPLSQPFKAGDGFRREREGSLPEGGDMPVYDLLPAPFVYFVRQMQAGEWHKWKQTVGALLEKEGPFTETVKDIISLSNSGGWYEKIMDTVSRLDEGGWKALKQELSALPASGEDVPLQAGPPLLRFLAEKAGTVEKVEKADTEKEKRAFIQAAARQMTEEKELTECVWRQYFQNLRTEEGQGNRDGGGDWEGKGLSGQGYGKNGGYRDNPGLDWRKPSPDGNLWQKAANQGQKAGKPEQKAGNLVQEAGKAADRLREIRESFLGIAGSYEEQPYGEAGRIFFPMEGRKQWAGIFPSVRWLKQENGGHTGYSGREMREAALNVIEEIREERIRILPCGEENRSRRREAVEGGDSFFYHSAAMVVAENPKGAPAPQEGLSGQKKPEELSADIVRQVREETDIRLGTRGQKAGESGRESAWAEMEKAMKKLEEQQKELEGKLLANTPEKLSRAVLKKLQGQLRIDRMRHGI